MRWRYRELLFLIKQIRQIIISPNFISFVQTQKNKINLELFEKKYKSSLLTFFKQIASSSYGEPEKFVPNHRDFHSRNILLFQNQTFFIDYQDAFMAPAEYDLASFLWDPYRKKTKNTRKELLLHYYKKNTLTKENYTLLYYNTIQRLYKAMGTYYFQINIKKKIRYLASTTMALNSIRQLPSELKQKNTFSEPILYFNNLLQLINEYLLKKHVPKK